MGFNIKNNYGPNIEVKEGAKVVFFQGKDGMWHADEAEEAETCEYEEVVEAVEPVGTKSFAAAVIDSAKTEAVICLLRLLMAGKQKPKDVMMPVRAAMDVGVIRRPTWEEFCSEFGTGVVRSKASFSDYTNPEKFPYDGADFKAMKAQFAKI